jgi:CRP-like cAMP-binding protein
VSWGTILSVVPASRVCVGYVRGSEFGQQPVATNTPGGTIVDPRYELASMIGSQREAVTKAFFELQESGCIEVKGRRVNVRDFDALRRSAGE